jgi:hypothetical protein
MKGNSELLAEHYQKTYELTFELWKQCNQTFLILIGVIGGATLLTFSPGKTEPLLVLWLAKALGVTDEHKIQQLAIGFPFGLLQSLLLIVIFYLMVNLYHRSLYVLRNYRYLAQLEHEIRADLALPPDSIAFTREGGFYWSDRTALQSVEKWCYIALVGGLLFAFLGGRVHEDFRNRTWLLGCADLVISGATAIFFLAYARSSVTMDTAKTFVRRP